MTDIEFCHSMRIKLTEEDQQWLDEWYREYRAPEGKEQPVPPPTFNESGAGIGVSWNGCGALLALAFGLIGAFIWMEKIRHGV